MEDIGIYTDIHLSGKVSKSRHRLYEATCKVCGCKVEKILFDLQRSNTLCFHKSGYIKLNTRKINDMPTGWINESYYNIRVYNMWKAMLNRTTERYWTKYPSYKDTTVCEDWRKLSNFARDIQSLEGYDFWKDNPKQRIMLDKDTKIRGNKLYSIETCCFISHADSNRDVNQRHPENIEKMHMGSREYCMSYAIPICAVNKISKESKEFISIKECSRELNIPSSNIWMCLSEEEKYKSHKSAKGWNFYKIS